MYVAFRAGKAKVCRDAIVCLLDIAGLVARAVVSLEWYRAAPRGEARPEKEAGLEECYGRGHDAGDG